MTTVFFSFVDISDGLWFLLDAPGMAMIAVGFARLSPKTRPVAAAFGIFAAAHVVISTDPDALGFLLGPGDLHFALSGVASTIWLTRTVGWGAQAGGVLAFTASILVIGPLLAVGGDTGLAWGLPLYSVLHARRMAGPPAWIPQRAGCRPPADARCDGRTRWQPTHLTRPRPAVRLRRALSWLETHSYAEMSARPIRDPAPGRGSSILELRARGNAAWAASTTGVSRLRRLGVASAASREAPPGSR